MAGFRSGRGRGSRDARQRQDPGSQGHGRQAWTPSNGGHGGHGEPEYFGGGGHAPQGGHGHHHDPYADNPGHTRAFTVGDPYGPGAGGAGGDGEWHQGGTYAAGAPVPSGPKLHWKDLLSGVLLRPNATFLQMRDHAMWGPALIVTFCYGLLAVFGLDATREDVLNATFSTAAQYVLGTGVAMVVMGVLLGVVTHTLARQFGGEGSWQPTVGLSMLIMSLTDAPRLLFAAFLGGDNPLVTVLGWVTWVVAGVLLTSMVSRSHELHWPRALGASAVQLLALLFLIKLGTL